MVFRSKHIIQILWFYHILLTTSQRICSRKGGAPPSFAALARTLLCTTESSAHWKFERMSTTKLMLTIELLDLARLEVWCHSLDISYAAFWPCCTRSGPNIIRWGSLVKFASTITQRNSFCSAPQNGWLPSKTCPKLVMWRQAKYLDWFLHVYM